MEVCFYPWLWPEDASHHSPKKGKYNEKDSENIGSIHPLIASPVLDWLRVHGAPRTAD